MKKPIDMKTTVLTVIFAIFAILPSNVANAQNSIQITASKNNTLYESAEGSLSNGNGEYIFAGATAAGDIRRALLMFDLSEIPEGSQIENAELRLVMNRSISGAKSMTFHEVLADWGEGSSDAGGQEGGGASAATGDATWVHTFFPDQNWSNTGGDYSSTILSTTDVNMNGSYTWPSTQEFTALVQKWLENPIENYGLILIGDESESTTAKRFSSRLHDAVEERPVLIVEYTGETTSNEVISEIPESVQLNQNYPNPFNPATTISFSLPEAAFAEIAVYDMLGRKLQSVLSEQVQAGQHTVTFDASTLSSGVYMYTLQTGNQRLTRRFTVLK